MSEQLPAPDELLWEERAADLELTMLDQLREHADKWRSGLISMTALVATAATITAPFVGTRLTQGAKTGVGIAALVAVLALAFGAVSAMRAAYGQPTTVANTGTALRQWTGSEVETSACWLRVAQVATLVGFVALVVGAGIGFTQSNAADDAIITPGTGDTVCGRLVLAGDQVEVTAADGTVHKIPLSSVKTVEEVGTC